MANKVLLKPKVRRYIVLIDYLFNWVLSTMLSTLCTLFIKFFQTVNMVSLLDPSYLGKRGSGSLVSQPETQSKSRRQSPANVCAFSPHLYSNHLLLPSLKLSWLFTRGVLNGLLPLLFSSLRVPLNLSASPTPSSQTISIWHYTSITTLSGLRAFHSICVRNSLGWSEAMLKVTSTCWHL